MTKRAVKQLIAVIGVTMGLLLVGYGYLQVSYEVRTKRELLTLAHDDAAIRRMVSMINEREDGWWTAGGIGITGDGYVFCYDLHDSHGMDAIADINILYLPDEKRFLVSRNHFCVDFGKYPQPKDKAGLLALFATGT